MKKINIIINKSITILIVLLTMNLIVITGTSTSYNTTPNKKNELTNMRLVSENTKLKNNYSELSLKIIDIENQINGVDKYDNYIYSTILGLSVDSVDVANQNASFKFDSLGVDSLYVKLNERTLRTSKIVAAQLTKLIESSVIIKKNKQIINQYPSISPIKSNDIIEISSGFGWRKHPIYNTPLFHSGIDIAATKGTNVYSTMNGVVIDIKYSRFGYGNRIVISNSHGFEILYAHLSNRFYVKEGQYVKKGQLIATTGNTGTSTGPHLHYEIRLKNKLKDPLGYFYTYLTNELIAHR